MNLFKNIFRRLRVKIKQLQGIEPLVSVQMHAALEFHGSENCGWNIPAFSLRSDSIVVDVGLGEDISFSTSLIDHYQCNVHGFDPTPRAIAYVGKLDYPRFQLHRFGVAAQSGRASFYLPNNELHVSGSLKRESHTGSQQIEVDLVDLDDMAKIIESDHIDLLKLDIEGAEYDLHSHHLH
jgi:FkbM family methyltransferase